MRMDPAKKQREREAVALLHDLRAFHIQEAEAPDFVLRNKAGGDPFGVEVTELHESEVEARLTHIPNYPLDLIGGAAFRHKDDADALLIDDVVFTSPDGSTVSGRAVGRRSALPLSVFRQRLGQLISEKNSKVDMYRRRVDTVDLLIADRTDRLMLAKHEDLCPLILSAEVHDAVAASPFASIHLVTTITGGRRVYVPLRSFFLVASVFQIPKALEEFAPTSPHQPEPLLQVHSYLGAAGADSVLVSHDGDLELFLGRASVRFGPDGDILVHEDWHSRIRSSTEGLERVSGPWDDPGFSDFYREYRTTNAFVLTVAFDVRTVPER